MAMEYKAIQTHCGQYRPYGDFFREWEIETIDNNKESVLNYCFENLYKRKVPTEAEWKAAIKYGNEKFGDAGYYFAGYYKLTQIEKGWKFIICEPFAD